MRSNLLCKIFGHRKGPYDEDGNLDMIFGCIRCKDPEQEVARVSPKPVPGRPDLVEVDPRDFDRFLTALRMLS